MRADPGLDHLYAQAAAATAAGSKSFYFATRFFPPDLARSAHAVYWFCRTTDDIVDECSSVDGGRRELDAWQADLSRAVQQGEAEQPILRLFLHALHQHKIPPQYAFDLLDGMRMDLDRYHYQTFADLELFCYRVASTVGLMMSHVIGFEQPSRQAEGLRYAEQLGTAMQLTNILRDIGEDLDRQRLYLPAEELDRFGVDPRRRENNAAFRRLMEFQVERARHYYALAAPGIPLLHAQGRFAVHLAAEVYARILRQIETNGYNVFTRRAVVPAREKYWLTARLMARPVARWAFAR